MKSRKKYTAGVSPEVPNQAKQVRETTISPATLCFPRLAPLPTWSPYVAEHPVCMIFIWEIVIVCTELFIPPNRELWLSVNRASLKSIQDWNFPSFLPFWLQHELRGMFVAFQCPMMRATKWASLYHVVCTQQCIESISVQFFRYRQVPHVQYTIPFAQYVKQWEHWKIGEVSHISKYSTFSMLWIMFFDFFARWVIRLILLQVGFQRVSIWMRFHLMNQLFFDHFFAWKVFFFHCGMKQSLNSVINLEKRIALVWAATGFSVLARNGAGFSSVRIWSILSSFGPSRSQYDFVRRARSFVYFVVQPPSSLPPLFQYKMLGPCCGGSSRSILFGKSQSLSQSNLQIVPIHSILMYFPSLLVNCNSGFGHVVFSLLV